MLKVLDPSEYRPYLSERAHVYLCASCLALGEQQCFASAIWAAVFLEALVDDFAQSIALPRGGKDDDLNGRIQQLQQWSRNPKPGAPAVPDEIIKRFHEIRNTRNRLVHDTGATKETLAQDAEFIHAGLQVVLKWYQKVTRPRQLDDQAPPPAPQAHGGRVPVFLSSVSAKENLRQRYFLADFMDALRGAGVEPVRCVRTLYDERDPLGKVRAAVATCRGAIILGLERTHAYFLRDREGTAEEKDATHRQYTSGWMHMEAGLANALGLDVFVLCQTGIHSDGIFDRKWNTYQVIEFDGLDVKSPKLAEFLEHMRGWAAQKGQAAPAAAAGQGG